MDVTKILAELKEERSQIEEAILSLERLARGRGRRRGRPPAWMAEVTVKNGADVRLVARTSRLLPRTRLSPRLPRRSCS